MGSKKSSSSSTTDASTHNNQAQLTNAGSGTIINLAEASISQSDTGAGVGTGGGSAIHVEQLGDDLVKTAFDWAGNVLGGVKETIVETQNKMTSAVADSVNASQSVAKTVASNLTKNDSAQILKIAIAATAGIAVLFLIFKK